MRNFGPDYLCVYFTPLGWGTSVCGFVCGQKAEDPFYCQAAEQGKKDGEKSACRKTGRDPPGKKVDASHKYKGMDQINKKGISSQ